MGLTGRFAHLHLHTQYSILDGAIAIPKLVERCAELGMPAVAMTDHGNMFGAVAFHEACTEAGIKPIIGCEVYVAQGSRFEKDSTTGFDGINHMVLLAMNAAGYANLLMLVSKGHLEGFYRKPRVDLELLRKHHEGLIATSGCLSGAIPSAISSGRRDRAWELVEGYSRIFKDRFYLELQRHGIAAQERVNRELLAMHSDLGLPLLATNDCHYLERGDCGPHEALLCVQTGKTLDDPRRFRFEGEGFYVKTAEEMFEVFGDQPEALSNSVEIAERCSFELETGRVQLPEFEVPAGETDESYLSRLTTLGMKARLGLAPDEPYAARHAPYAERLRYELGVIQQKGFTSYFLICWDVVRHARERGIPVGPGRGSGAGSLVGYALRIVDVDPVEYTIPFERFLNPERPSMPDFDIDFCMNRRGEVIRYVEEKYNGEASEEDRRVAGIVTFGTMQAKAAVRDCGRVLGVPFAEVDKLAKLIPDTLGIHLKDALLQSRELREKVESDPKLGQLMDLALSLEGQIRNAGRHAAGIVISSRPLIETTPLYRDQRSKEVVIQYDYRQAERMGLIKFDLLGLRTLTIIHDAQRRVRENHDPDFDIEATDLADPDSYALLSRGDTFGVFQLESPGCTDLVVRLAPRSFRDVIALIALYRPGPLLGGNADQYVEGRHGRPTTEPLLPELAEVLADTHGVIVYQDQVLSIASHIAGYSMGQADILRRAMGKKDPEEMEAQRARFVDGAVANGHPRDKSRQLFDVIQQFAGYGFGKAHAAAYAVLTHQTAYLKAHYPAEFYAATMTVEWREQDRLDRYMKDAAERGIQMMPPSVNESGAEFSVTDGGRGVRFGLAAIKNVGEGAVEALLEARAADGPFESLFDFCARVDTRRVNRRVIECLIRCGAFDFTKATRASLWEALAAALGRGQRRQRDREQGQGSLFGDAEPTLEPRLGEVEEWPRTQLLAGEKEMLGFYVTGHPLLEHEETLALFSSFRLDQLAESTQLEVWLGGMLSGLRTQKTRRGELMARARLEDLGGAIDAVIFPKVFDRCSVMLRSEAPVLIRGSLMRGGERPEIHVDEVVPLADAWQRCAQELTIELAAETATTERLRDLRAILDLMPGKVPVRVELRLSNGTQAVLALPRHPVSISEDLVRRVDRLFGARVARCRVA